LFAAAEGDCVHGPSQRMNVTSLMDGRNFLLEVVEPYADAD
jgi:hypothetical protein